MHKALRSQNLKGRDHLEDLSVDGKTILEGILGREGRNCGLDSYGSR